jgi:predicted Zn-dependent protease
MGVRPEALEPDQALALLEAALTRIDGPAELCLAAREERTWLWGAATVQGSGAELIATARVWREGRCGMARRNVLSEEDLDAVLEEAAANAPAGPLLAVPSPAPVRPAGPRPARSERELLPSLAEVAQAAERWGTPLQALLARRDEGFVAVASHLGVRAAEWLASDRLMVRLEHPKGALVDGVHGPAGDTLDVPPLLTRLGDALDALDGEGGAPEPGLPWLLSPSAAAPLVSGLGWLLSGDTAAALPGLARALGKRIFPACLTFTDGDGTPPRAMDDEGQPRPPLTLVSAGKLEHFALSSDSAQTLKQPPNGRGVRLNGEGHIFARALAPTVMPQDGALPRDVNALTARMETFVAAPRAGKVLLVLAGWVVRDGEKVRRIAPFEVELPVLDTFRGLLQIGPDAADFPTVDGARAPSLLITAPKT